ncbi:pyrroline-5-carboxylate reductase [Mycolicibacterium mucogenicum]|uniref:pyrroline-5-carboxylate reductase n=1 Tax=Mycolicibacterium mucogenicum TaxID=56689 RepID=UPI00195128AD|nr:pyrroline-5-carboxylate reductase [Mycolicibacterium mucogenicum]
MARIAIIGGGNIGEALLAGLLQSGRQVKDLVVAEAYPARAAQLAEKYSVRVTDVADAAENAAYVIVAVKPDAVEGVVETLADAAADADSSTKLPAGSPVVRVMPNTPMLVGAGITALSRGRYANDAQLAEVSEIFSAVGAVLTVPEKQMDAVTAVSGSGPAYFFLMVEAVVDAGVAAGLPRPVATELAAQTMAGAAAMLLDRMTESGSGSVVGPLDTSAAQLRASVTSPGGTTAAGLRELERGGLRSAVASAVEAAKTRSEQLRITSE